LERVQSNKTAHMPGMIAFTFTVGVSEADLIVEASKFGNSCIQEIALAIPPKIFIFLSATLNH